MATGEITYNIEIDEKKLSRLEKAALIEKSLYQNFYTQEEMNKTIDALREKYNISICDGLPYNPTSIKIKLTGECSKT